MIEKFKRVWKKNAGFGTVELVILVAILVGIALLFRGQITDFVNDVMGGVFSNQKVQEITK